MVKSVVSIIVACTLFALAIFAELSFVQNKFALFSEELQTLSAKVEEERANGEDAKTVRTAWDAHKTHLHVWIPHNDIARIDDLLSETVLYVERKEYILAAANLEILLNLCKCVPATYFPLPENIL